MLEAETIKLQNRQFIDNLAQLNKNSCQKHQLLSKCTLYSMASKPLKTNSNKVFKFSGLGAVTKILEYLREESMSKMYNVLFVH
jgi:hypothetical protein